MNRFFVIGNLTADVQYQVPASGVAVSHFNVAENYMANGEKKTNYFRVTAFRKTAENCSTYLSKGKKVAIIGRMQQDEYTNNNGETVKSMDVIAEEVQFLSPTEEGQAPQTTKSHSTTLEPVEDDSLPF